MTPAARLPSPSGPATTGPPSACVSVPVRDSVTTLVRRGYDGWVSIEWEKKWHPQIAEPEVALPQHAKLLREWVG